MAIKILLTAVGVAAIAFAVVMAPDLQRYLKIRSM